MTFAENYKQLLQATLLAGVLDQNKRTGAKILALPGGTSARIDLAAGVPCISLRKTFPRSAAAEVAWFVQGLQDVSFIRKYAPLWDKFVEPDGHTVEAAYGHRWRHHFGRDQLQLAVDALRDDPSDRQINVSAWDPSTDGLGNHGKKNVPCPTNFTLSILNGELHSSLFLRSSDLFVGLPYDVMGHALLMDAIAVELEVNLGSLHITLAHAHIYDTHWEMTHQALTLERHEGIVPVLKFPGVALCNIEAEPAAYVEHVAGLARMTTWPEYNPKPHVVE